MFAFLALLLALALDYVDARAVFAHFMVFPNSSPPYRDPWMKRKLDADCSPGHQ